MGRFYPSIYMWSLAEIESHREEIKRLLRLRGGPVRFYFEMEDRMLELDKARGDFIREGESAGKSHASPVGGKPKS